MGIKKIWKTIRKEQSEIMKEGNHDSYMNGYFYGLDSALYIIAEEYPEVLEKKSKKQKKIVPFDFALKEDKQILRGKTVEYHCLHGSGLDKENPVYNIEECNIVGFHKHSGHDYWQAILQYCNSDFKNSVTAEELLDNYFFVDTGKPVGKEVKE